MRTNVPPCREADGVGVATAGGHAIGGGGVGANVGVGEAADGGVADGVGALVGDALGVAGIVGSGVVTDGEHAAMTIATVARDATRQPFMSSQSDYLLPQPLWTRRAVAVLRQAP